MKFRFKISSLLIGLGLVLIVGQFTYSEWIQPWMLRQVANNTQTISASTISDNIARDEWDTSVDVEVLSSWTIPSSIDQKFVVGYLAIPAVELKLPILNGASKRNLAVAVATIKPQQKMGEGNYAVAGHLTRQSDTLFTPLQRVKIGDLVYLSDKTKLFIYQVEAIMVVLPQAVEVIEDVDNQSLLTLVTCQDLQGKKRLVVSAKLLEIKDYQDSEIQF